MIVIDASVAMKWFVAEPLHDQARRLLDEPETLLAPDLLLCEAANVAWKKARLGELRPDEAARLVSALLGGVPVLRPSVELAARALGLAGDLDHPVYRCLYLALALALQEDTVLITADRRFHQVVEASEHAGGTAWLGDA